MRSFARALTLVVAGTVWAMAATPARSDPAQVGRWEGPYCLPLLPIHSVHLHTGEILMWGVRTDTAHLLDIASLDCLQAHPAGTAAGCELYNDGRFDAADFPGGCLTEVFNQERHTNEPDDGPNGHRTNIFCAGHAQLADGRIVVTGGHITFGNHMGRRDVNIFRPDEPLASDKWQAAPEDMTYRRWYPTHTLLPDGRMLITTGSNRFCFEGKNDGQECRDHGDCGVGTCTRIRISSVPEIYDPDAANVAGTITSLPSAELALPFYPFNFVLPDGRVFFAGAEVRIGANVDISGRDTHVLDLEADPPWQSVARSATRGGAAVMFEPGRILKTGGDPSDDNTDNASTVAEAIDMTIDHPAWDDPGVADMHHPRTRHSLTVLPNGEVLVTGGTARTTGPNNDADGQLVPEIYSFDDNRWTEMEPMAHPRMYHSEAILLPDGRVLSVGGGHGGGAETNYYSAEIFWPPYLFTGTPRPVITSAPESLRYGDVVEVGISDVAAGDVERVTLHRLSAITHAFDQDQRYLRLPIVETPSNTLLEVLVPPNARVAPPGHYMLFVVSDQGVPSVARYVHVEPTLDKGATDKPTVVWVDYDFVGVEEGTFHNPFNTVQEGVDTVTATGVVRIKGGTTAETPTIQKALTLETYQPGFPR